MSQKSQHQLDLEKIREDAIDRMEACDSDQNYVQLGKLVIDVWKQLNEITGEQTQASGGTLTDFQRRLADRRKTS